MKGASTFLLVTVFLDVLGTAIFTPLLAYIVRLYATTALTISMMTVVYAAAQFASAPVLGRLSDRYGRRPVLLVSVLGSAVGYYLFGIGGALWILFLSRLIDGATGGNVSTAQACLADLTPPNKRARAFALMGAVFSLGFTLGPAVGGVLGQVSVVLPAFGAGTLSLLSVAFGYFALPETLPTVSRHSERLQWSDLNPIRPTLDMAKVPGLGVLILATFIFNFVYGAMASNFSFYTMERFGAEPLQNAMIFTLVGSVGAATQLAGVPTLVPRLGERSLALLGLVIQICGFLGVVFARSMRLLYPVSALLGIGNGLMRPSLTALISNSVSPLEQGHVAGVTASITSLTYVLGPLWAGISYDRIMPTAPYWTGALLLGATLLLLARSETMAQGPQEDLR
jgi:MFS family permease